MLISLAVVFQRIPPLAAEARRAYTVYTRDGSVVLALARPEIRGLEAYVRLAPRGTLAVIQEELIDWQRTEAANGEAAPLPVPASGTVVQAPGQAEENEPPITKTIVGEPAPAADPALAESGKTTEAMEPADAASLKQAYARTAAQRDQALSRRLALQTELGDLITKGAAPAGGDDPAASRVNTLRKEIDDLDGRIRVLEERLEGLRDEAARRSVKVD
jgi:hypothetical protein